MEIGTRPCSKCGYVGECFHPSKPTICKKCLASYQREYRKRQHNGYWVEKDRRYGFKKKYGITLERYDEMVKEQDGRCAICLEVPDSDWKPHQKLQVDHSHTTGAVRGLLCNVCNTAVSNVHDDVEIAKRLVIYLERPSE